MKLAGFGENMHFLVIFLEFHLFHEMCTLAPRPPQNIAIVIGLQCFWEVIFGPKPKRELLLIIFCVSSIFMEKMEEAEKTRNALFHFLGGK